MRKSLKIFKKIYDPRDSRSSLKIFKKNHNLFSGKSLKIFVKIHDPWNGLKIQESHFVLEDKMKFKIKFANNKVLYNKYSSKYNSFLGVVKFIIMKYLRLFVKVS